MKSYEGEITQKVFEYFLKEPFFRAWWLPMDEEKQKEIHSMFEDIRFKREWFFATKKLREFIEEKRKLYQNESNGLFV